MPNYNYRSNDYMRRGQYPRQMSAPSARIECEYSSFTEDCSNNCRTQDHSSDHCMYDLLSGMPIAMAYVPWQEWQNLHSAEKAFCQGTIFEDLDKPFLRIGGCQK